MKEVKSVKEAIEIVLDKKKGYRDDLILEVGSEELVDELALLGYISQGSTIDNNTAKRTWRKTVKADNYARFFIDKLEEEEEKMGLYLDSVGF